MASTIKKKKTLKSKSSKSRKLPASPDLQALARHIIQFDAEDPATYSPQSLPPATVMLAGSRSSIAWPAGSAPTPTPITPAPAPTEPLPPCDYLVVTWTAEEGRCLADTLTPGYPSKTAWYPYTHLFVEKYVPIISPTAPSIQNSHRLGSYFVTHIKNKTVLCFKSELHMSQDGPKLPIRLLWKQLIAEVKPKLVITTGTAGGIGASIILGDVVVAPSVRFDCTKTFKSAPFHKSIYNCSPLKTTSFITAQQLFAANLSNLPPASRSPRIFTAPAGPVTNTDVVTTDFFAFDDSTNHFGLESLGAAVEMGDAVLGLAIKDLGAAAAPKWAAVRNASDPQIDATGLTFAQTRAKAGQIYEKFGYWTTISSAIASWALILDN